MRSYLMPHTLICVGTTRRSSWQSDLQRLDPLSNCAVGLTTELPLTKPQRRPPSRPAKAATTSNLPEKQADSTVLCGGSDLRADLSPEVGPICMPISTQASQHRCRSRSKPIRPPGRYVPPEIRDTVQQIRCAPGFSFRCGSSSQHRQRVPSSTFGADSSDEHTACACPSAR